MPGDVEDAEQVVQEAANCEGFSHAYAGWWAGCNKALPQDERAVRPYLDHHMALQLEEQQTPGLYISSWPSSEPPNAGSAAGDRRAPTLLWKMQHPVRSVDAAEMTSQLVNDAKARLR